MCWGALSLHYSGQEPYFSEHVGIWETSFKEVTLYSRKGLPGKSHFFHDSVLWSGERSGEQSVVGHPGVPGQEIMAAAPQRNLWV